MEVGQPGLARPSLNEARKVAFESSFFLFAYVVVILS